MMKSWNLEILKSSSVEDMSVYFLVKFHILRFRTSFFVQGVEIHTRLDFDMVGNFSWGWEVTISFGCEADTYLTSVGAAIRAARFE